MWSGCSGAALAAPASIVRAARERIGVRAYVVPEKAELPAHGLPAHPVDAAAAPGGRSQSTMPVGQRIWRRARVAMGARRRQRNPQRAQRLTTKGSLRQVER